VFKAAVALKAALEAAVALKAAVKVAVALKAAVKVAVVGSLVYGYGWLWSTIR
jgi:hypothetical protein